MARRKIRHFGPYIYDLSPDEVLVTPDGLKALGTIPIENKPRLGKGSGRAGGARSSTHKRDHLRCGRVYLGTTVENCPICRYGIRLWLLWEETGGWREEWFAYWEGNDGERQEFERFVADYKWSHERDFDDYKVEVSSSVETGN